MGRIVRRCVLVVAAAALATGPFACEHVPAGPPPVFDQRPLAEARAAAAAEGKLLVVKATADWCGPCKHMDATTWRDEHLVAWLKDRAIVVPLDVDEHGALARDLGLSSIPTMLVFRGDEELDRLVGAASSDELIEWLEPFSGR
ncbi:MAG: thioredoxin family protein [Phycisphaerae bacterium]|nr:thioredoxin family protein [Phycisphaerae bacterium]